MIRWLFDLICAVGFFVLALASWIVEALRAVLLFVVVVPVLVGRVLIAAANVAIEWAIDKVMVFFRRR